MKSHRPAKRTFDPRCSPLFQRAAASSAESQRLVSSNAELVMRARTARASSLLQKRATAQARRAWLEAEAMHRLLRTEVEQLVGEMLEAGVDQHSAVTTVRAQLRFVLYDGGLTEQDAEPVVQRATAWVNQIYDAA